MPDLTSTFPQLVDYGDILLAIYDDKWSRYQPLYPRYFNIERGDRRQETISGLVPPGELDEISEGQATPFQSLEEMYKTQITFVKWAKGIQFTEEAIRFDKSNRLKRAADKFANSARHTQESRAARVLNNATSTNHAESGEPLVHNSQEIKATGGTFDNRIDGDLSVSALDSAFIQFRKFVDDRNLKINIQPRFLIVTPDDERVARQLVGSEKEPYSADNQINVFKGKVEVIVNPWLSDADTWFLVSAPEDNGLYYIEWQGMRRKAWVDQDADVLKFKATQIMEATFHNWRGVVGGIGA